MEYDPVLLYKAQGLSNISIGGNEAENETFLKEDFALAIQTKFQMEMMAKFGYSVICCDSTHGTNHYSFPLTTLMVIDEFGEGIPVAWLISNHENGDVISKFFQSVKEKTGCLEPAWFMTDDAPQYFTAWQQTYGISAKTKNLICRWHIDRSWRRALNDKVSEKEDRISIYHHLMVLMLQSD